MSICKNCSTGAEVITRARELVEYRGPLPTLFKAGEILHHYCEGYKRCDCQHRPQGDNLVRKKEEPSRQSDVGVVQGSS